MNPARSLGPALVAGDLGDLPIYLVGPVIGAVGAVLLTGSCQGRRIETARPRKPPAARHDSRDRRGHRPARADRSPRSRPDGSTWPRSATPPPAAGLRPWAHATQTVFGEGPVPARWMLVGEQPGEREDVEGAPFVGPAGGMLDKALAEAGIDREATSTSPMPSSTSSGGRAAASAGSTRRPNRPRSARAGRGSRASSRSSGRGPRAAGCDRRRGAARAATSA